MQLKGNYRVEKMQIKRKKKKVKKILFYSLFFLNHSLGTFCMD